MVHRSLKNHNFAIKSLIYLCPIHYASLDTLDDFSLHNRSLKFLQKSSFRPFSFKVDENHNSFKYIPTLIVEHMIDQFLLTRSQKKHNEKGYDIFKDFFL